MGPDLVRTDDGVMAEVRVWDRVLSDEEIARLARGGAVEGSTPPDDQSWPVEPSEDGANGS